MERIKQRAWEAALSQLATDYNAQPGEFLREGIAITQAKELPGRRQYTQGAPFFQMATTGRGAVITPASTRRWQPGPPRPRSLTGSLSTPCCASWRSCFSPRAGG